MPKKIKLKKKVEKPLMDAGQIKFSKEQLKFYKKVLNIDFLFDLSAMHIENQILRRHIEKISGELNINEIKKPYLKEVSEIEKQIFG